MSRGLTGLYGIIHLDSRPIDEQMVSAMARALVYFGDAVSDSYRADCFCGGEVFNRKATVSLRALAASPENDPDFLVLADARIDNRQELTRLLGLPAEIADRAVLISAFRRWGESCCERIIGDYAFAIWQHSTRRLFAARDHMGARPFVYHFADQTFAFASAARALLAGGLFPRRANIHRIGDFLLRMPSPGGLTFFDQVYNLPAGHWLRLDSAGLLVQPWWRPTAGVGLGLKPATFHEPLKAALEEAIRCRLDTSGRTAILLSGGLDSGAVACLAANMSGTDHQFDTYTLVPLDSYRGTAPAGWDLTEEPYLKAIKQRYPLIKVHRSDLFGRSPLSSLERSVRWLEGPWLLNHFWIDALLEEAAGSGVRTLLTGQMGNTTISWEDHGYLLRLARGIRIRTLAREILATHAAGRASFRSMLLKETLLPLVRGALDASFPKPRGRPWLAYSTIHPDFAAKIDADARFAALYGNGTPPVDPFQNKLEQIAPGMSDVGDRWAAMGAKNGMEISDPTADRRVMELCLAAPEGAFREAGILRLPVRRALEGVAPACIQWRETRGEQAPDVAHRLSGHVSELASAVERFAQLEAWSSFVDVPRIRALFDRPLESNTLRYIWPSITLGVFLDLVESGSDFAVEAASVDCPPAASGRKIQC